MAQSIRAYTKVKRAEQPGTMIGVRLQADQLLLLDGWIAEQREFRPTRPEAIRRLIELGLEAAKQKRPKPMARKGAPRE